MVGRVIARPYIGTPGNFTRTENRRDFSLPLPEPSILSILSEKGFGVITVGKLDDIFPDSGITESFHVENNRDAEAATLKLAKRRHDAAVTIGTHAREELNPEDNNQQDPSAIQGGIGIYDNDENYISGAPDFNVTCVGLYNRMAFIDPSQYAFTANGGWTRRSITPVAGTKIPAKGAITYKWEKSTQNGPYAALLNGRNAVSFQVETSGNLSQKKSHANKPY